MAIVPTLVAVGFCFLALLTCASAINDSNYTNGLTGNTTAVLLDNQANFAVCVYPASVSTASVHEP